MSTPTPTPSQHGIVQTWPRHLLRLEGACVLGTAIWSYSRLTPRPSWWTFAGLVLLPDVGMVGYLSNTVLGAALYNAVHTETPAVLLLCVGLAQRMDGGISNKAMELALIWLAHIGMDRMFGFGLKYGTGFGHTHLGLIGGGEKGEQEKKSA